MKEKTLKNKTEEIYNFIKSKSADIDDMAVLIDSVRDKFLSEVIE